MVFDLGVATFLSACRQFFHITIFSHSHDHISWLYKQLTAALVPYTKKRPDYFVKERTDQSLKVLRTPHFAEATTVYPEAGKQGRPQLTDPPRTEKTQLFMAGAQPFDIGFAYIDNPSRQLTEVPLTPDSPLKSTMEVPGTPGQKVDNPRGPIFRDEQILEKNEEAIEKEQARDLVRDEICLKIAQHN